MSKKQVRKFLKQVDAKAKVSAVAVLMIVVALSTVFVLLPDTVKADEGTVVTMCTLPAPKSYIKGAWDSTRGVAYLFGGQTEGVVIDDKIVKFDPVANTTVNVSVSGDAMYPVKIHWVCYDSNTDAFYIFGGYTSGFLNNISRFWPSNNTFDKNICTMPVTVDLAGGVLDADNHIVYLLSGRWAGTSRKDTRIMAYNISNNTAWITGDTVQTGVEGAACSWNDNDNTAYLFGGCTDADDYWDGIQAYCPGNHTSWSLSATLPTGVDGVASTVPWDSTENLSFIIGGITAQDVYTDDIVEYNYTSNSCRVVNNLTRALYLSCATWDNTNRTCYVHGGAYSGGTSYSNEIWKFNLTVSAGDASTFTIKGLSSGLVTWSGEADTTVWCNSSGTGNEWLEANMSVNSTDNITELRVFMDDLDNAGEYINASNITMYVSSDNSSYGEVGSFLDGGGNCTTYINSTNWNAGTMGADPFTGAGLTDKDASIYLIFKLTIPAMTAQTYTSATTSTYKVWFCSTT